MFPLPGTWVRSLVRKLRAYKLCSVDPRKCSFLWSESFPGLHTSLFMCGYVFDFFCCIDLIVSPEGISHSTFNTLFDARHLIHNNTILIKLVYFHNKFLVDKIFVYDHFWKNGFIKQRIPGQNTCFLAILLFYSTVYCLPSLFLRRWLSDCFFIVVVFSFCL